MSRGLDDANGHPCGRSANDATGLLSMAEMVPQKCPGSPAPLAAIFHEPSQQRRQAFYDHERLFELTYDETLVNTNDLW
jgi:hypothetical protein